MKLKVLLFVLFFLFYSISNIDAQLRKGGVPYSFTHQVSASIEVKDMPEIDTEALLSEDRFAPKDEPYRFGYGFDVSYSLQNSGIWEKLPDGGKLWRLKIISRGAYSINLIYDNFWLPEGAKFFIYNHDKSMVIGAFTSQNNKPHGKFATGLVKGDEIILEYYEPPSDDAQNSIINISRIVHAYKDFFKYSKKTGSNKEIGFDESGSCNNNVHCEKAEDWQNQVRSVGMIVLGDGTRLCTGSLLNNVEENYAPYFLTANHCLYGDLDTWIIWFNYESSTCDNPDEEPTAQTLVGASLKANNSASDFAILMLDETPPLDFNVYYNGWSNINTKIDSSVCIHHPSGDIKKISYDDDSTLSTEYLSDSPNLTYSHWRVVWDDGTTEPGSSGSPLYNPDHKVVGQLHGGYASCSLQDEADWFGKFSKSWNYGSSSSTRLRDWLDPDNTGITALDGMEDGMLSAGELPANATWSDTHTLTGNITVPSEVTLDIQSDATINLGSYSIISSGGTITIESGATINSSNSHVRLVTGSTINDLYSTIASAMSIASSGQTIEIYGPHTLTTSYSIPSGLSLSIKSGATVTIGSYSIVSSGGTITVASDVTLSPDVRRKSGSTVLGLYPSITSALSEASSEQTVEYGGSHTLSSNLTVSSGRTLIAKAGSILSFGSGYYLSVSGTLNASGNSSTSAAFTRSGSSGTWGGIRYYSGSSGSLQYANISNAYYGVYFSSSSATISNSIISSCTYGLYASSCSPTITNVNISGCTYGVRPYYSSLSLTNSTISSCSYGVYSYYGSPTMRYNSISSCTYGAYLNHANSAVVSTNAITACTRGVYGYYAGLSDFVDNYITSGGSARVAGIQVYNTTEPTVYNNTIEGSFTYGLDADHYSRPLAIGPGSQDYQGYNRIIGGQTATVYAHDHSESVLGTSFTESTEGYAGYNTIYLDIQTDRFAHIRAENYSNIIAQKNYWGDYPPSDFYADGTSSIDYSYPLSSDPGGGSSLAKMLGGLLADALYINIMPFDDAESVETLWQETTEQWQSLQYQKALENCNILLQNYPDSPYAPLAFLRSVYAKRALKSTDMQEYLQKYVETKSLRTMALELLIGEDLSNQRFEAAVEKSKTVIKENPDTEAEYKAMFGLFNLYSTDLEDKENAQTVLDAMKGKYADYGLTQMAQFEMGETVDWQLAKPIAFRKEPEPEVVSILPDKFELKPNYPNPFNPTTNIAFALPEASDVRIAIYDLTGREIWRSVKSNYAAGNHTLTWNGVNQSGANVVSGIYLVRMVTHKYTATQRIVLMK